MNDFTVQQGWQCPICKRVYSPLTMMCYYCGGESIATTGTDITITGTGTFSDIDWKKQQTVTTTSNQQIQNFTSISNGRDTFTAEDTRTCDTCKHHNNHAAETLHCACRECFKHDRWEKI